ncbi:MAG: toll/interleukin-1 receptor domain-containing protein [Flavobacteriaceae bacterium]|nr:toll/interleukin-1 receptor domain-containing protein [Flavobacteriaceae bacterium]
MKRLDIEYSKDKSSLIHQVVRNGHIYVDTAVTYFKSGHGHTLIFFLEGVLLKKIDLEQQKSICSILDRDLHQLNTFEDEFIYKVALELYEEDNPDCKASKNLFGVPMTNANSLGVWNHSAGIRLFISHRDNKKAVAKKLAAELEHFGINSFVAHDTIQPMEKWQQVIRKALQTMNLFLAFVTDDFFDSHWTNQEVGIALGRGIPIISIKLENTVPSGFISDVQALSGSLEKPEELAGNLFALLVQRLDQQGQLKESIVQAFIDTPSYKEAKLRFHRLKQLDNLVTADVKKICDAYNNNSQLHESIFLNNGAFKSFIEREIGQGVVADGNCIVLPSLSIDDIVVATA